MNKAFLRRLARHMRRIRHEEHYDQATFGKKTGCGTAACLAGHAVLIADGKLPRADAGSYWKDFDGDRIRRRARVLMGLPYVAANHLFSETPGFHWPEVFGNRFNHEDRKSRVAADLLDALANGKVKL